MRRYVLAYDADCGPCTRFRRAVGFLDTYGRMDYMSLNDAEVEGLLDNIPIPMSHRSFHLVSPEGGALSGAEALPELVRLLPSGTLMSKMMTKAPGGMRAIAFAYGVASRLHDVGSCKYRPGQAHAHVSAAEILPHRLGALR